MGGIGHAIYGFRPGLLIDDNLHHLGGKERPVGNGQQIESVRQTLIGNNQASARGAVIALDLVEPASVLSQAAPLSVNSRCGKGGACYADFNGSTRRDGYHGWFEPSPATASRKLYSSASSFIDWLRPLAPPCPALLCIRSTNGASLVRWRQSLVTRLAASQYRTPM